jgi:DNA-binding NarL/FixJ family response regulator
MAPAGGVRTLRLVVAVHTREVKTALFLALNGLMAITIVATATSTAELVSYCRAFRPDVAVVESGLPGRPFDETLQQLAKLMTEGRIFVIDCGPAEVQATNAEVFTDIDDLVAALPVVI